MSLLYSCRFIMWNLWARDEGKRSAYFVVGLDVQVDLLAGQGADSAELILVVHG